MCYRLFNTRYLRIGILWDFILDWLNVKGIKTLVEEEMTYIHGYATHVDGNSRSKWQPRFFFLMCDTGSYCGIWQTFKRAVLISRTVLTDRQFIFGLLISPQYYDFGCSLCSASKGFKTGSAWCVRAETLYASRVPRGIVMTKTDISIAATRLKHEISNFDPWMLVFFYWKKEYDATPRITYGSVTCYPLTTGIVAI